MPTTESGLEGPGIEPKPEVEDISTDKGFARALREQPGGDSLPASAREMGPANSPHRKAWVQRQMDEGQARAEAQITSKEEFDNYIIGPGAGNVQAGLELPPADAPEAPAQVEDTTKIEALQAELTTTKASLSEAQQHEATMLAYDGLEEALDQTDVNNTLSALREALSAEQWTAFKLDAIGGGLVEPEELEQFSQVWESERAFESAYDQSAKAQAEAAALKESQLASLQAEQRRLGLNDKSWTLHLQDVAEAARQLGMDFSNLPKEEYPEEIKKLSALVAETRRAFKSAAVQEALLGAGSRNVEQGLTIFGDPVTPYEPIEPRLDLGRMVTHSNIGKPFDIAQGVIDEDKKARSVGDTIAALARKADRDAEAKQARAKRQGF